MYNFIISIRSREWDLHITLYKKIKIPAISINGKFIICSNTIYVSIFSYI